MHRKAASTLAIFLFQKRASPLNTIEKIEKTKVRYCFSDSCVSQNEIFTIDKVS